MWEWKRNKLLLFKATETWGAFVTAAEPNPTWLIQWVNTLQCCGKKTSLHNFTHTHTHTVIILYIKHKPIHKKWTDSNTASANSVCAQLIEFQGIFLRPLFLIFTSWACVTYKTQTQQTLKENPSEGKCYIYEESLVGRTLLLYAYYKD